MTTPLALQPAAVRWSQEEDLRLPRNYGDAAGEYQAARDSAGVVDRCDRALLRFWGRDPLRILQGMLSNDVLQASPTQAVYAAMLTPKGKMLADVRVFRRRDDFLLDLPATALPALSDNFRRTVPPLFARWEDFSEQWHILGVYGPEAAARLAPVVGGALPGSDREDSAAETDLGEQDGLVVSTAITGGPGYDVVVPTPLAERVWHALVSAGVRPMGHAPLDVLRIEAGVPAWGAELTPDTIPLEAGLHARAISTTKGCYTGQEVIIRILHRGHVNWLLRGVLLGAAAGATRGTPLLQEETGRVVGRITSTAWSPRMDQEVALAYVRRELDPGATALLGGTNGPPARIVTLPFAP